MVTVSGRATSLVEACIYKHLLLKADNYKCLLVEACIYKYLLMEADALP